MGWPKGVPRGRKPGVEQGNAAEPEVAEPPVLDTPDELVAFIDYCERARLKFDAVLVRVSHPQITAAAHRDGVYSGFQMTPGEAGATWSDGTHLP